MDELTSQAVKHRSRYLQTGARADTTLTYLHQAFESPSRGLLAFNPRHASCSPNAFMTENEGKIAPEVVFHELVEKIRRFRMAVEPRHVSPRSERGAAFLYDGVFCHTPILSAIQEQTHGVASEIVRHT